ncbi:MAG: hypothetical protein E7331_12630 [Clostridiales bacterium]|nr:hypothetical protein [Clostridiales bacterium]
MRFFDKLRATLVFAGVALLLMRLFGDLQASVEKEQTGSDMKSNAAPTAKELNHLWICSFVLLTFADAPFRMHPLFFSVIPNHLRFFTISSTVPSLPSISTEYTSSGPFRQELHMPPAAVSSPETG